MKKNKGKQAKKGMSFLERNPQAEKWLAHFTDDENKDIVKCYRKKFAVDRLKAVDELQRLGVKLTKEQIAKEKKAVKAHQQSLINRKRNKKRKKLEAQTQSLINMDQDDTFYYIAGYTSGGEPYGVTWEEMGLEPYEDIED